MEAPPPSYDKSNDAINSKGNTNVPPQNNIQKSSTYNETVKKENEKENDIFFCCEGCCLCFGIVFNGIATVLEGAFR